MGEILILRLLIRMLGFFFISSFLFFCAEFFIFSVVISLLIGFYRRGWLGVISFLVFIGGILVILFYLGIYGTYYSLVELSRIFLFGIIIFFPIVFFSEQYFFRIGEISISFLNILYLGLISLLLYFLLRSVRKILGVGRAMRSFF